MSELTAEQEKIERRRQKRQQRILQSGESRLSKITGTAYRKFSLITFLNSSIFHSDKYTN